MVDLRRHGDGQQKMLNNRMLTWKSEGGGERHAFVENPRDVPRALGT